MNEYMIYQHQNNFEKELIRLRASALSEKTKKQIEDFAGIRLAKGPTKLRVVKCMWCIRYLAIWLGKDFSEATKEDLIKLVTAVDSKGYSDYTTYDIKVVLRLFYRWLKGNDEDYPPEIKWLKPRMKNKKHKLPEELLAVEEVERMANATTNPRDKALILTMYESGCRIGQSFDGEGITVKLGQAVDFNVNCNDEKGNPIKFEQGDSFTGKINIEYYFNDEGPNAKRKITGNIYACAGACYSGPGYTDYLFLGLSFLIPLAIFAIIPILYFRKEHNAVIQFLIGLFVPILVSAILFILLSMIHISLYFGILATLGYYLNENYPSERYSGILPYIVGLVPSCLGLLYLGLWN